MPCSKPLSWGSFVTAANRNTYNHTRCLQRPDLGVAQITSARIPLARSHHTAPPQMQGRLGNSLPGYPGWGDGAVSTEHRVCHGEAGVRSMTHFRVTLSRPGHQEEGALGGLITRMALTHLSCIEFPGLLPPSQPGEIGPHCALCPSPRSCRHPGGSGPIRTKLQASDTPGWGLRRGSVPLLSS